MGDELRDRMALALFLDGGPYAGDPVRDWEQMGAAQKQYWYAGVDRMMAALADAGSVVVRRDDLHVIVDGALVPESITLDEAHLSAWVDAWDRLNAALETS